MNATQSARNAALEHNVERLEAEAAALRRLLDTGDQRLAERLDAVRAEFADAITTLEDRHRELMTKLSATRTELATATARKGPSCEDDALVAVRSYKTFTVDEIATEVGVSVPTIKKFVAAWMADGVITATGAHAFGKKVYEHAAPTDAGAEFRAQQAEASKPKPERHVIDAAIAGTGSRALNRVPAEVRAIVAHAVHDRGWELLPAGKSKSKLVRGDQRITIPNSPRNASNYATWLEQKLAERDRQREPVAA